MPRRDERIEWNEKYPIGTMVRYWGSDKDGFPLLKVSSSSSRYADTEFDLCDTIHPCSEEAFSGF